mmetsp:Transcript_28723/g.52507  ORF Transcript_28723/g.52507 Transcript_28723/m.52507 type:complete len:80 (-) Transcript_28723:190-429(-)
MKRTQYCKVVAALAPTPALCSGKIHGEKEMPLRQGSTQSQCSGTFKRLHQCPMLLWDDISSVFECVSNELSSLSRLTSG